MSSGRRCSHRSNNSEPRAQAFLVIFRQTLNRELDTALGELTKRLSEGKR